MALPSGTGAGIPGGVPGEPDQAPAGARPDWSGSSSPYGDLEERYRHYRKRQARRLVHMLPREAVRPLYRKALGLVPDAEAATDPLAVLVEFCERILPLPPFAVWRSDVERHPGAYLYDLDDGAGAPTAAAPSPIERRWFRFSGRAWTAVLNAYRDGDVWRGFVSFASGGARPPYTTAPIFCEPDPDALRERFQSFDSNALKAFLRSATP
ncbi:MAG: hypothetical protein ACE5GJ_12740 [Gemmatimonadota bacterium]